MRALSRVVLTIGALALWPAALRAADVTGVWVFDPASSQAFVQGAATAMAKAYPPEEREAMQAHIQKAEAQLAEVKDKNPAAAAQLEATIDSMKKLAADPRAYFEEGLQETAKEMASATLELRPGGEAISKTGDTPDDLESGHWTLKGDQIDIIFGDDEQSEMKGTVAGDHLLMKAVMPANDNDPASAQMAEAMKALTFVLVRK